MNILDLFSITPFHSQDLNCLPGLISDGVGRRFDHARQVKAISFRQKDVV